MKKGKTDISKLETLTAENMDTAASIICKTNPEWGSKQFTQDNSSYRHHSVGSGTNSSVLFESEFHFWAVYSTKQAPWNRAL